HRRGGRFARCRREHHAGRRRATERPPRLPKRQPGGTGSPEVPPLSRPEASQNGTNEIRPVVAIQQTVQGELSSANSHPHGRAEVLARLSNDSTLDQLFSFLVAQPALKLL